MSFDMELDSGAGVRLVPFQFFKSHFNLPIKPNKLKLHTASGFIKLIGQASSTVLCPKTGIEAILHMII